MSLSPACPGRTRTETAASLYTAPRRSIAASAPVQWQRSVTYNAVASVAVVASALPLQRWGGAASRRRARRGIVRLARSDDRAVRVDIESRVERKFNGTTVEDLDDLLASEGLQLMVSGAQSSEPAGSDGQVFCYMPVMQSPVPGIGSTQIRLTCSMRLPRSGLAILKTEELANLIEDGATGKMVFDEAWSTRGAIKAEMSSTLMYRRAGAGLSLVNAIRTTSRSPLPEWFPIPEAAFSAFVQAFVREALTSQQNTMIDRIQQRCAGI